MNNISINNRFIDKYQPTPTLYYDIKGKLLKNDGKDITVEKSVGSKVIEYNIKLKEEIDNKIGNEVNIDKENIQSIKMKNKEDLDNDELEEIGKIINNLNIENSEEYQDIIENLIDMGIKPTKENIESYKQSKNSLNKVINKIDTNSIVKLIDKDIDFENLNLLDASNLLDSLDQDEVFSIKEFLGIEKELDYKDAEKISKEIYGQKMGKDIYDIIIALDKEGIDIEKHTIDKALDVMSKVYELKNIEDEDYVVVLKEDMDFSINSLFKIKNEYTINTIEENKLSKLFEEQTIIKEVNYASLEELLQNLNIEISEENISIGRAFILNDMDILEEDFVEVKNMKNSIDKIKAKLNNNEVVKLLDRDVDLLNEDIDDILEVIDLDINDEIKSLNIEEIEDLKLISKIEDKDLLKIIKSGKDFNLKNIKEVINSDIKNDLSLDFKVLDRSKTLVNMFDIIGEIPSEETLNKAIIKNGEDISLNNLYKEELNIVSDNGIVDTVETEIKDLVVNEYMKARNNISTTMIKESIKDNKNIFDMPIIKVNKYIDKKVNRYKEISEVTSSIKNINLNQEKIVPIIMKNELSMTLKEIKNINDYFLGKKGLTNSIENLENDVVMSMYRDEIISLQEDISKSLKEDSVDVKENYKNLLNLLNDSSKSLDSDSGNEKNKEAQEYIKFQNKISKKDTIFQLPIEIGGEYKDLNIIIPSKDKVLDKNNMSFSLSLSTKNLGYIDMDLKVIGREIYIDIDETNNILLDNIDILFKSFEEIGYNLNI